MDSNSLQHNSLTGDDNRKPCLRSGLLELNPSISSERGRVERRALLRARRRYDHPKEFARSRALFVTYWLPM